MKIHPIEITSEFYKTVLNESGQSYLIFTIVKNMVFNNITIQQICVHFDTECEIFNLPSLTYPLASKDKIVKNQAVILENSQNILRDQFVRQKYKEEIIEYVFKVTDEHWIHTIQDLNLLNELLNNSFDDSLKELFRNRIDEIECN